MFAAVPVDDDADDDASVFGPPLPPDDRLWRHPSELNWQRAAPGRQRKESRPWGLAMVAGTVGAVVAVGAIALVHGFEPTVVEQRFDPSVSSALAGRSSGSDDDVAAIAADVSTAIARLEARTAGTDVTGSAVVVRDGAYLVTNAHLVEGAEVVRIFTADGKERDASVVGTDKTSDVAVLKIAGSGLAIAKIGSTADLRVGERAIAVGAPAASGSGPSVTVGVVSALGRRVDAVDGTPLHGVIQTDAPVAPEAAGGALVDGNGAIIGITTVIGDNDVLRALGTAIPIEIAMDAADDIIATGHAHYAWLGIEGEDLDADMAKSLGLAGGARVRAVVAGSPAANAGLAVGDVIVAFGDTPVASISALVVALRVRDGGDAVAVGYVRGGKQATATVTLADK